MRNRKRIAWAAGFTITEIVIVLAITAVAIAVTAPMLVTTRRVADLRAAQAKSASAVRRASEQAATGGSNVTLSTSALLVADDVLVDPYGVQPPPGTIEATDITFQGGTGYPWAFDANQPIAIVCTDRSDPAKATAIVLGPSGTVSRWRLSVGGWEG